MLKKLMLASALVATSAFAQQNTDISGANFQSGKADAALASLGRAAAASGRRLVITAPPEWHQKILAKVHAGGNADVVLRDGFYENVLVRTEDKSADKAAKPEADASRAEVEKARAEAERSRAEAQRAKADAERSRLEAEKARAEADAATARLAQQAAAARAAAAAPARSAPAAAAPVAKAPAATAPAAPDADAVRARLEKTLNEGRSASGTLDVAALQSGDVLYVDGPVKAVTRREGLRPVLYWVEGDLDLRRSELKPLGTDRYQVLGTIRGEGSLRREFAAGTLLAAAEPAAGSPARSALEKSLNDAHPVTDTMAPAGLRNGDVIYTNGTAAMVVRREGRTITRYWLVGSIDLGQTGIQADGANKYKVLIDTIH